MDESLRQAMRLWTLAQPVVSGFVASVVRDPSDRDDVLQEIAIAVVDSFARYDPQRPFVGSALGIAKNQVRLYLRRERRDRHVFDDDVVGRLAVAFEAISDEQARPLSFLRDCLGQLEVRARELCDLRYVHGLKPAAIAAKLGMGANTVAKALQRIRDQLRDCIESKSQLEGVVK